MRPKLFAQIVSLEARKSMSYRVAFWAHAIGTLVVGFVIPYFLWQSIYQTRDVQVIGGYTFEAMVLYYILAALLGRVVRGPNLGLTVANEIYQGGLTKYCVYPTRYRLFKYAQHLGQLAPQLVLMAVIGAPFLLWLGGADRFSLVSLLQSLVLIGLANGFYFLMSWPVHALAFWADNIWSLAVLLQLATQLLGGVLLPVDLFPEWAYRALLWTPFPHLFFTPVRTLLGQASFEEWASGAAVLMGWSLVFAWIGTRVWRRGELQYTGVGI